MSTLIDRFQQMVAQHGEKTAIKGNHWVLTYRDLAHESARLAAVIQAAGAKPGDVVPIFIPRSPNHIVSMLALLRLGCAYAPIDLASPPARQRAMLQALKSPVVLTEGGASPPVDDGVQVIAVDQALTRSQHSALDHWHPLQEDAPLYVMFTSGSTGAPKGVVVPHRGVTRLVVDTNYMPIHANQRWGFLSSPAFDLSTLEVWAPLLNGGCCVVQETMLPSVEELASFFHESEITETWLTASLFNAMVDERPTSMAGLKHLVIGGERLSVHHVERFLQACPNVVLINGYGPTENTTFSLCHTISLQDTQAEHGIPIGTAIRGTTLKIGPVDDQRAEDTGELLVGGLGVALGYLNSTELTQAKFIDMDGETWYRTGDLVRVRPDGVYDYLGRIDRQVKIQGNRIELEEVESTLQACPTVGNAAVLVVGDDAMSRHIVGLVSGVGNAPVDVDLVQDVLAQKLPPIAIPKVLRVLPSMPTNINGKLDRNALAQWVQQAHTAAASPSSTVWETPTEATLADIWGKIFPSSPIEASFSFRALGGTSLLAMRVASEVRTRLHKDLNPIEVLKHDRLTSLAQAIDESPDVDAADVHATSLSLLTRAQRFILLASQLRPEAASAYLMQTALALPAGLPLGQVREAFVTLAQRHPALRLLVTMKGATPHAQVADQLPSHWWIERSPLAHQPSGHEWPTEVLATISRPLDLSRDGVMRVDVWPVRDGSALLVWTVDHISLDDPSVTSALAELDSILAGRPLPPVYGSPFSFSALERVWTQRDAFRRDMVLLAQTVQGHTPPLPLPPKAGHEVPVSLDRDLAARLQTVARQWGCTAVTPLLAAYGLALQDTFGEAWRYAAVPFSRRSEPETVEPLGYFIDLRLMDIGAQPGEGLADTVKRLHRSLVEAQAPEFRNIELAAELLQEIDPSLTGVAMQFGFTWRDHPFRAVPLGGHTGQALAVPQDHARFGVCLHCQSSDDGIQARLEAVSEAHAAGQVAQVSQAFLSRLQQVLMLDDPLTDHTVAVPTDSGHAPQVSPDQLALLAKGWRDVLHLPASGAIKAQDHFFKQGGTSLLAIRLAAALHRDMGKTFPIASFLKEPTFQHLVDLVTAPEQSVLSPWSIVGPQDFSHFILVIPGIAGSSLGMFTVAEALRARLPDDHAVVTLEVKGLVERAPKDHVVWFLEQQVANVVKQLGRERLVGVLGFSAGGLLGARVAQTLSESGTTVPLWMLDTYAPERVEGESIKATLQRWANGIRRRLKRQVNAPVASAVPIAPVMAPPTTRRPDPLMLELDRLPVHAPLVPAYMIQASGTREEAGLIWRPGTNGLPPRSFRSLQVLPIDTGHMDLVKAQSAQVVALMLTTAPLSQR